MSATQPLHAANQAHWMMSIGDMDNKQFQQWSTLLEQRTGMTIKHSRKSFLITGIKVRMRELGFSDYQAYYNYLLTGRHGAVEWATLVDRLTIHETRFYRHANSFKLLSDYFLPDYLSNPATNRTIQAWSVGCATGEECYTLAITLDDYKKGSLSKFYYGVTGSDISLPALATARKGAYDARKLKELPESYLQNYFSQVDDNHYRIHDAIKKRVCFNQLNILDIPQHLGMMDIILCQNVLIYFENKLRHKILDSLTKYLEPGGILIIGVAEAMEWKHPEMERISMYDTLAYRKTTEEGATRVNS